MNITKEQIKEIIREELQTLNEKTIRVGSIKVEMSVKGGYPLLRIHGPRGYVEVYGRPDIKQFCNILKKNFRIV